jgi:steroid delta-isomerase-like uncharacterized protein
MKGGSSMATDLKKMTKDLYAAISAHDIEKILPLHTDDVFYEEVLADGKIRHGKEELRNHLTELFAAMPDFTMKLTSSFAFGNKQCEECILSGTHTGNFRGMPATGNSLSFRAVVVRELKRGKTSRISCYYDSAIMMRQLV